MLNKVVVLVKITIKENDHFWKVVIPGTCHLRNVVVKCLSLYFLHKVSICWTIELKLGSR